MTDFANIKKLDQHLKNCLAAKALIGPINKLFFCGERTVGHPLSRMIQAIHRNVHLIKSYANAVSDDLNSLERTRIHYELCERLDLDYKSFRPFESENITTIPNRKEAEEILWEALGQVLKKL